VAVFPNFATDPVAFSQQSFDDLIQALTHLRKQADGQCRERMGLG
jgi:hypothetical protein